MKMEPIVSSETSAIRTQRPGNYPKRNKLHLNGFTVDSHWARAVLLCGGLFTGKIVPLSNNKHNVATI